MPITFVLFVIIVDIVVCIIPTKSADTTPIVLGYKPMRPPYAGATGGNWVDYAGQKIPEGTPWPAKPEDYHNFSTALLNSATEAATIITTTYNSVTVTEIEDDDNSTDESFGIDNTTSLKPISSDHVNESTTAFSAVNQINTTEGTTTESSKVPVPNRPPLPGPTGGNFIPQLTPWPVRPGDDEDLNITSQNPNDNAEEVITTTPKEVEVIIPPKLPVPNRPTFLGHTGGNFIPQLIPSGTPWPARPKDEEDPNITTQYPSTLNENTEEIITTTSKWIEVVVPPKLPMPNRPPFLGPTGGNFIPQLIPSSTPWPSKPKDEDDPNITTQYPTLNENTEETITTTSKWVDVIVPSKSPVPNRPPFLGPTGGNFIPQLVPPGKPWSARPEDYESHNVTTQTPNSDNTNGTTSTVPNEIVELSKVPAPSRPSFLGPTGGNFVPESVPPAKPWPARPEDYEGYNISTQKPSSDKQDGQTTTTLSENQGITNETEIVAPSKLPVPNAPYLAGDNLIPQSISPGIPCYLKPENLLELASQKPSLSDNVVETNTLSNINQVSLQQVNVTTSSNPPVSNTPSLLESTGENSIKPEDYDGYNVTSEKPSSEHSSEYENEKVIFPDNPVLNVKITSEHTPLHKVSKSTPHIFSVAFYLGNQNSDTENNETVKNPSLVISIDMDALKDDRKAIQVGDTITNSMGTVQQFLASEKVHTDDDQSKHNYSVNINLGDLVASSKKSSARINIGHAFGDTIEERKMVKDENLPEKRHTLRKEEQKSFNKDRFLSVFVNLKDFRNMRKERNV